MSKIERQMIEEARKPIERQCVPVTPNVTIPIQYKIRVRLAADATPSQRGLNDQTVTLALVRVHEHGVDVLSSSTKRVRKGDAFAQVVEFDIDGWADLPNGAPQ